MRSLRMGLAAALLSITLIVTGLTLGQQEKRAALQPVLQVAWWGILFGPVGFESVATKVIVPGVELREGPLLLTEQEVRELPTKARSAVADWVRTLFQ